MNEQVREKGPAEAADERLLVHHLVQADDALTSFHYERAYFTGVRPSDRHPESAQLALCECELGDEW